MTAEPVETDQPDVLQMAGATDDRDKSNDHIPFVLGDEPFVYHAHRPKMKVLLRLAAVLADDSDPIGQALSLDGLLDRILEHDSLAELNRRLEDPDDDFDYDSPGMQNTLETLVGLWYGGRPTGGRAVSRGSSSRTGRRSTVRARSAG